MKGIDPTVAVDLGGTFIKIGIYSNDRLIASTTIPSFAESTLESRLPAIEHAIAGLLGNEERIEGFALAFPGIVNTDTRMILSTPGKFSDSPRIDLADWVWRRYRCRFAIENDANAALLGECRNGCAKGVEDAILFILGTGIGTAAMMGGRIVHGVHYQAGILGGHLKFGRGDERCVCGCDGCLEAMVGSWSLAERVKRYPEYHQSALSCLQHIDYEGLFNCYSGGDELAKRIRERTIDAWARGISALVHAYDPQVVVLSGGVIKGAAHFAVELEERVRAYSWTAWGNPEFRMPPEPGYSVLNGLNALLREAVA